MAKNLNPLFFFGRPFSPFYGAIMKIREQLYTKQLFRQHSLDVPVISVGNLVLGGTGKTPTVIFLAKLLSSHGYKVAIVSRGYGGSSKSAVNVVSSGEKKDLNPVAFGDEPVLMATLLDNTPVVTGKKRVIPCTHAIEEYNVDCIILDDGFQHLGVQRDINLVLFDAQTLAGNSRIFPGGPLREPVTALHRASAFLLTGQTEKNLERSNAFKDLLEKRFPSIPVYSSKYSKPCLQSQNGQPASPETIDAAYLFCAIANPERVRISADELCIELVGSKYFRDHNDYNQQQIDQLCHEAEEKGAKHLITTAKDLVKLSAFNFSLPLFVLQIEQQPEQAFTDYVLNQIKRFK